MSDLNYVIGAVFILMVVFLCRRYIDKHENVYTREEDIQDAVKIHTSPMIWIHVPYEWNARRWKTFWDRGSYDLNAPYLLLCIESIVRQSKGATVAIIDDRSFKKILPEWDIQVDKLSGPVQTHVRMIGMMRLLYEYGGMIIPPSTICMSNLFEIHNNCLREYSVYVGEYVNERRGIDKLFKLDIRTIGCKPKCELIRHMVSYLEHLNAYDYTSESEFLDRMGIFCEQMYNHDMVAVLSSRTIGTCSEEDNIVTVHELMSDIPITFAKELTMVYIPHRDILSMPKYMWYASLSREEVMLANNNISRLLKY